MSSYSLSIPLDDDGYLRRECPSCEREFKWHYGPTANRPADAVDPLVYYCPMCGESAPTDHWWTQEQLNYVRDITAGPIMRDVAKEFQRSFRQARSGQIKFKMEVRGGDPAPPAALHEPNDMVIVMSPCHSWEPVKLPVDANGPYYCLLCGQSFAA